MPSMLSAIKQTAASFRQALRPSAPAIPAQPEASSDAVPSRAISQVISEEHAIEGPGFEIARPFPTRSLRNFDPWLLFDAFGPRTVKAGDPLLRRSQHLGQHPHRGFQAITYHIAGDFDHYDSTGKHGRMQAGSVQLMTAGGGIVHGGAPAPEAIKSGTFLHGYQIWLALPASQRMCAASTTDWHGDETPVVGSPDGRVWARVISSSLPVYGTTCVKIRTAQPIMMVHFVLQPGGVVRQPVPASFNVMLHVSIGTGRFGPDLAQAATAEQAVLFKAPAPAPVAAQRDRSGAVVYAEEVSLIEFACPADATQPLDVLLLAGLPTGEPIVQYGPFVGGSMEDIHAARIDFNAGLMGALAPDGSAKPSSVWAAEAQPGAVLEGAAAQQGSSWGGQQGEGTCWPVSAASR